MLTTDEEKRIVQFVTDRVNLGVGLDFDQLKSVILLIELKKVDKERYIPPTWENCYPEDTFVRRFADRNRISLRRTGRNVRKPEGSARFDPQSAEWRQIWEDQARPAGSRQMSRWTLRG